MCLLFVLPDVVLVDMDRVACLLDTLQAGQDAHEADCERRREPYEEVGQGPCLERPGLPHLEGAICVRHYDQGVSVTLAGHCSKVLTERRYRTFR